MTFPARYREALLAVLLLALVVAAGWRFTDPGMRLGGVAVEAGQPARSSLVAVMHPDCETPRLSGFAQPVSAASALALVAVGLGVLIAVGQARGASRSRAAGPAYGATLGAAILVVGAGSFAFHRAPTAGAAWLEGFGIAAIALWWLAYNLTALARRGPPVFASMLGPALVGAGLGVWLLPTGAAEALQITAIAAAAATEAAVRRRGSSRDGRRLAAMLAVFAAGVAVWRLSRFDGPWCDPGSLVQGHALWHVLAATGLALGAWYLWSDPEPAAYT